MGFVVTPGPFPPKPHGRLPDYLIIGTMKSGTSSLYYWLAEHPGCAPAAKKEPDFFSSDELWGRGPGWYCELFAHVDRRRQVGEASTSYSKPLHSAVAAERIASLVPQVRLIYLLRHPIERLRSHYRHEVRRGRERRSLLDALRHDRNYVGSSRYHACLSPYIDSFPRKQICIVRSEDLFEPAAPAWQVVLDHLGLAHQPPPRTAHNVTADKPHYTKVMLWLWSFGALDRFQRKVPNSVRRLAGAALLRKGRRYDARLEQSWAEIPEEMTVPIWEDVERLEAWLGCDEPLWERTNAEAVPGRELPSSEGNQIGRRSRGSHRPRPAG